MKYYRLVIQVYAKENGITVGDLELLFYLHAIPYFTRDDFLNGTVYYTWDNRRFEKFRKTGWIKVVHNGNRQRGEHNQYTVTVKCKLIITNIYRILCGKDNLPEAFIRSRRTKNAKYLDKVHIKAMRKMAEERAKEKRIDWDSEIDDY